MSSSKQTVIIVSGRGGNDAVNGLMRNFASILEAAGLNILYIDISLANDATYQHMIETAHSGVVTFAFGYAGVGNDWVVNLPEGGAVNMWEYFKIPFLKIHGDMPAYYLSRHDNVPNCSANLYPADEFLRQLVWFFPNSGTASFRCDPWLISDTPLESIDFERRKKGPLVFVKNGGSTDALVKRWADVFPASLYASLCGMAETITPKLLHEGHIDVHKEVIEHLEADAYDPVGLRKTIRLFIAQIDDFSRRVKSTMIAQALLELPVQIQGGGWDHLKSGSHRATFVEPQEYAQTEAIFHSALGVIDMSPNIDSGCHDRMMRAAGTYAYALTNRTTWLGEIYPAFHEKSFDFTPQSITESAAWAIDNPDACIELGIEYGRRFRARYSSAGFAQKMMRIADYVRVEKFPMENRPQSYFMW